MTKGGSDLRCDCELMLRLRGFHLMVVGAETPIDLRISPPVAGGPHHNARHKLIHWLGFSDT